MYIMLCMHLRFIMELHSFELNWWCSFLECRSEINILWNDSSIQ